MHNRNFTPGSGDLIYVPSHARLRRMAHGNKDQGMNSVTEFVRLDKPTTMLVFQLSGHEVEVVYQGTRWLIDLKHAYPVPSNHEEKESK